VTTEHLTPAQIGRRPQFRGQPQNATAVGPELRTTIAPIVDNAIDALTLDPFIKAHGVSENDNGAIDRVGRQFAAIAKTNSSIELPCHVRKTSSSGRIEITVNDTRGASSLVDAARSNRILNAITIDEAHKAQTEPETRKNFFRMDDGKQNMAPPVEAAT
jgi:hypothetical protein